MNIIDISTDILRCGVYPGDPSPEVEILSSIKSGGECNLSAIKMSMHTGTHIDAPLHFIENGSSLHKIPLSIFIGPCSVVEAPPGPITGDFVERKFPRLKERILVKSGGKAYFHETAAEELAYQGVKLIGTDALSIGTKGDETKPHKAFMIDNVVIMEGLNLSAVKPGEYFLMAQPLKISGVEAAPCRAVLVEDYVFWSRKQ